MKESRLENAHKHVYESSCIACHENLFPPELTKEGEDAHLYYTRENKPADLQCINCHLDAGHYIAGYVHGGNTDFTKTITNNRPKYTAPATGNRIYIIQGANPWFRCIFQYDCHSGRHI